MKDATKYQTKIKPLLTGLKRVRVPADSGDPIRLLVQSVMEANATSKDVDKAMATFDKEFVDLNELRVAQPREIVEMLSKSFPHVRAKAIEVTDAMNRIFNRVNDLSMAYMADMAKRDLRRHLIRIGLSPYAAARILSVGFEGHAVSIPDYGERKRVAEEAMARLVGTRDLLKSNGIEVGIVSAGGTGTYNISGDYDGVTEIQAGSYATMDAEYDGVGVGFESALTIVSQVVSAAKPDKAIIDAGVKSATTEFGMPRLIRPEGWTILRLAEEHGILRRQGGEPLRLGDKVEMVPSHGCTTINLYDAFQVIRDETVEAVWPIAARGCNR